jgi:hypothetical protein
MEGVFLDLRFDENENKNRNINEKTSKQRPSFWKKRHLGIVISFHIILATSSNYTFLGSIYPSKSVKN